MIEGVSGAGKTVVCEELLRRGYHAIHGDRQLSHRGAAGIGQNAAETSHRNHLWHVDKVKGVMANRDEAMTFFCGGFRNHAALIHLFDAVFILEVDAVTLNRRLDERAADEFGHSDDERNLVLRLHRTREDLPRGGTRIDATAGVAYVVDEILSRCL